MDKPKNASQDKAAFDNAEGGILVTKTDGTVLYTNQKIADKTGFAVSEIIGKKPGDLWGGHMDQAFYESLWRLITHKQPFNAEATNVSKTGKPYTEQLYIAPIIDSSGAIKYFIEIMPPEGTGDQAAAFQKRFINTFTGTTSHGEMAIHFLFEVLQVPMPADLAEKEVSSFVETTLVEPTQTLYHDRIDDQALVLDAQKDSAAYAKLYEKYVQKIKRGFLLRLHDETLADDLTQETFLQAFKSLPRFVVSNASYLTYLQHIAHNVLVSYFRAFKPTIFDDAKLANIPDKPIDYATLWDIEALWHIVQTLKPIEQTVLRLKYQADLPVKTIAERLGKSDNAVKITLSRARKKLQQGMVTAQT